MLNWVLRKETLHEKSFIRRKNRRLDILNALKYFDGKILYEYGDENKMYVIGHGFVNKLKYLFYVENGNQND